MAWLQLLFQRLEDLGADNEPREVRRLRGLGADEIGPGPGGWHVLRDPSGPAFCVTGNSPTQTRVRDIG